MYRVNILKNYCLNEKNNTTISKYDDVNIIHKLQKFMINLTKKHFYKINNNSKIKYIKNDSNINIFKYNDKGLLLLSNINIIDNINIYIEAIKFKINKICKQNDISTWIIFEVNYDFITRSNFKKNSDFESITIDSSIYYFKKINSIFLNNNSILKNNSNQTLIKSITKTKLPNKKRKRNTINNEPSINWNQWVSASKVRNYMLNDPLLDWLDYFNITSLDSKPSKKNIYKKRRMDNRLNQFEKLIINQGNIFENLLVQKIKKNHKNNFIKIAESYQARNYSKVQDTINAIKKKIPIIYQPVLQNNINKTYGCPDLIIRSDYINKLVNYPVLNQDDIYKSNGDTYYLVVDIKCSTLHFNTDLRTLRNSGSAPAYKGQVYIYNQALSQIQNYEPKYGFIMGKAWHCNIKGIKYFNDNPLDRLGVIDFEKNDKHYIEKTKSAIKWLKNMRKNGHKWKLLPYPNKKELYPNMCNEMDGYYKKVKSDLAIKIKEITSIWMCGINNRKYAFNQNVYKWTDLDCNSDNLGIKGNKTSSIVNKILEINRSQDVILPKKIK